MRVFSVKFTASQPSFILDSLYRYPTFVVFIWNLLFWTTMTACTNLVLDLSNLHTLRLGDIHYKSVDGWVGSRQSRRHINGTINRHVFSIYSTTTCLQAEFWRTQTSRILPPSLGLAKMTPRTLVHMLYNECGWLQKKALSSTDWRKRNISVSYFLTFNDVETCY
jgi:hypothetical protein